MRRCDIGTITRFDFIRIPDFIRFNIRKLHSRFLFLRTSPLYKLNDEGVSQGISDQHLRDKQLYSS
jgi:hypothetical protein